MVRVVVLAVLCTACVEEEVSGSVEDGGSVAEGSGSADLGEQVGDGGVEVDGRVTEGSGVSGNAGPARDATSQQPGQGGETGSSGGMTPYVDAGTEPGAVSLPAECGHTRPAGNDGEGFFVDGSEVFDPNGCPFRPMGFNGLVFWLTDSQGTTGDHADLHRASLAHMASAGANVVRIVSKTPDTAGGFGWSASPSMQRTLVEESIEHGLVPMLEMHDATCDEPIAPVRSYWESPAMVELAQDHERELLINVANEHNFASPEAWRDYYIATIQSLRSLGVRNLIVLDAGDGCGQNPEALRLYGRDVLDADPQHNVLFSFHMYGFWVSLPCDSCDGWTPPFDVDTEFQRLADTGLPLFVGEFGWDEPATMDVRYDPEEVLARAAEHGFGWAYWAWYENTPSYQAVLDMATPGQRSPAGEHLIPYLQAHAEKASIFADD